MSNYELRPAALPHRRQRLALRALQRLGWTMRYKPLPGPHGVVIVYPHTSNWDVVIGLLGKWALGLPFRWLAKEALFQGLAGATIGRVLRRWGAVPVERSAANGATAHLAEQMRASEWFWLALAPEGTRGYRPHWRSGFYHLAAAARVPVVMVYLDYANKELGVVDNIRLTGDQQADMAAIAGVYRNRFGLHPELAAPVKLAPPKPGENRQA
jgi:1-acyl-sn-glycerol-3-phosphate acyltransferase